MDHHCNNNHNAYLRIILKRILAKQINKLQDKNLQQLEYYFNQSNNKQNKQITFMKHTRSIIKRKDNRKSKEISLFEQALMSRPSCCKCNICLRPQIYIKEKTKQPKQQNILQTNFGILIKNDFMFLALHLRNQQNQNPTNIKIPEICFFHESLPYDMIYSENGHIRSQKFIDQKKIKRMQMYNFFRKFNSKKNQNEHYILKTIQNQYTMLSDMDFMQLCYKSKFDPIWSKIEYIQNKIEVDNYNYIKQIYDSNHEYPSEFVKMATQSLLGQIDQRIIREQLNQQSYLMYVSLKIAFFLNFQHNIRLKKCTFLFLKAKVESDGYILVNAEDLEFKNLTQALKRRNERIQKETEERNKILLLSPEKEDKIKKFVDTQNVHVIQNHMNRHYQQLLQQLQINSIHLEKNQDSKNETAFIKLFPKSRKTYKDLLTTQNFYKEKEKILGIKERKGLINDSKNRFYTFQKIMVTEASIKKKKNSLLMNTRNKTNTKYSQYFKSSKNATFDRKRYSLRTQISDFSLL